MMDEYDVTGIKKVFFDEGSDRVASISIPRMSKDQFLPDESFKTVSNIDMSKLLLAMKALSQVIRHSLRVHSQEQCALGACFASLVTHFMYAILRIEVTPRCSKNQQLNFQ